MTSRNCSISEQNLRIIPFQKHIFHAVHMCYYIFEISSAFTPPLARPSFSHLPSSCPPLPSPPATTSWRHLYRGNVITKRSRLESLRPSFIYYDRSQFDRELKINEQYVLFPPHAAVTFTLPSPHHYAPHLSGQLSASVVYRRPSSPV